MSNLPKSDLVAVLARRKQTYGSVETLYLSIVNAILTHQTVLLVCSDESEWVQRLVERLENRDMVCEPQYHTSNEEPVFSGYKIYAKEI